MRCEMARITNYRSRHHLELPTHTPNAAHTNTHAHYFHIALSSQAEMPVKVGERFGRSQFEQTRKTYFLAMLSTESQCLISRLRGLALALCSVP